jgi:hypothetical protein
VVAKNVEDLHGSGNNISRETALTEHGTMVPESAIRDVLTGSRSDGGAFPPNINVTCNNWTNSTFGSAELGHIDATPSWNSAHMSRSCSQPDLISTGGRGMLYCFAADK